MDGVYFIICDSITLKFPTNPNSNNGINYLKISGSLLKVFSRSGKLLINTMVVYYKKQLAFVSYKFNKNEIFGFKNAILHLKRSFISNFNVFKTPVTFISASLHTLLQ